MKATCTRYLDISLKEVSRESVEATAKEYMKTSRASDIRERTQADGKHRDRGRKRKEKATASKAKVLARPTANHQHTKKTNIQMRNNDPLNNLVRRDSSALTGEQTGDDMFMFAICKLRSTIHDTHTHAILVCPQRKLMVVQLLIRVQWFRLSRRVLHPILR